MTYFHFTYNHAYYSIPFLQTRMNVVEATIHVKMVGHVRTRMAHTSVYARMVILDSIAG